MGKWSDIKLIGRGAQGSVHLVRRESRCVRCAQVKGEDGQLRVAKKVDLVALRERERQAAHREVGLLRTLTHPHIVQYIDSYEEDDRLVLVMEWCQRGDLARHIARTREAERTFCDHDVLRWFAQMSQALEYMHDRRVLHRDLKSSNVFLTSDLVVKLGDLGIAKILESTLAEADSVVGTPQYLSPELCENRPYSYSSDVWALGCVLYELCALKRPFNASNLLGVVNSVVKAEIDVAAMGERNTDLKALVARLLLKDAALRPDAGTIVAETRRICARLDAGGATAAIEPPPLSEDDESPKVPVFSRTLTPEIDEDDYDDDFETYLGNEDDSQVGGQDPTRGRQSKKRQMTSSHTQKRNGTPPATVRARMDDASLVSRSQQQRTRPPARTLAAAKQVRHRSGILAARHARRSSSRRPTHQHRLPSSIEEVTSHRRYASVSELIAPPSAPSTQSRRPTTTDPRQALGSSLLPTRRAASAPDGASDFAQRRLPLSTNVVSKRRDTKIAKTSSLPSREEAPPKAALFARSAKRAADAAAKRQLKQQQPHLHARSESPATDTIECHRLQSRASRYLGSDSDSVLDPVERGWEILQRAADLRPQSTSVADRKFSVSRRRSLVDIPTLPETAPRPRSRTVDNQPPPLDVRPPPTGALDSVDADRLRAKLGSEAFCAVVDVFRSAYDRGSCA